MAIEFGNLENVNLREVWQHEANDFTPWLAKNLNYISDAIGIPLDPVGVEVPVGRFSADILARNPMDDGIVLIENQLEGSDHTHLGQILTYLAGLEARTVIWIASGFTEAHLSAIRWLNENTADSFQFFAICPVVVKIGDSPLSLRFEVLERPSDWDRQIRAISQAARGGQPTELGTLRHDFWATYSERHPNDGIPKGHRGSNVFHSTVIENVRARIPQLVSLDIGVGIYITSAHNQPIEPTRERIRPYIPNLMRELGIDPERPPASFGPNFIGKWLAQWYLEIDVSHRGNWHIAIDWLHEKLEIYRRVLSQSPHG